MVRITYTVTYDVDGGSSPAPIQPIIGKGQVFIIASYEGNKAGHTFAGWSEGSNIYEAGYEYTVGDSDVVLTAVWNINQYTITFDANGATGKVPETITAEYDSVVTLPDVGDLAKTGYTFGGWMSDDKNIFRPGGTFTIGDMDVTLTAIWCLDVDLVADGTVEVEHSSVSFSQVDVETGKE
jgi:uncharacterized repeat protein (TIGR02543 family)